MKFIAALAKATYTADQLTLSMNEDQWRLSTKGSGYFYAPGVTILTDDAKGIDGFDMSDDYNKIIETALNSRNFGAAIDLGFSYDILKWLTVSASVTDLGIVRWNGLSKLGSDALSLEYNGFENIGSEDLDVQGTLSGLGDELIEMIHPRVISSDNTLMEMLSMTAHAGVELRVPFYKRLSAGVLGTYRHDGAYSWWEARASVNWALFRWLSFSGSYAQSTYGESYGGAINFHPNVLNIFVGVDSFKPALNVTSQYIPIDSFNTNLAIGVNLAFGKYHGRFPRKNKSKK